MSNYTDFILSDAGSVTLFSYKTFFDLDHDSINSTYIDSNGDTWLKTGQLTEDIVSYPDITFTFKPLKVTPNYIASYGGVPYVEGGIMMDYALGTFVLINNYSTGFWRWGSYNISTNSFAGEIQDFANNKYANRFVYNGNNYSQNLLKTSTGSVQFQATNLGTPLSSGNGTNLLSATNIGTGYQINTCADGDYIIHSQSVNTNGGSSTCTIFNATTALSAGTTVRTQDIVGTFPGYGLSTGNGTTFYTVEGANEISGNAITIAKERNLSDGSLTGKVFEFPDVPKSIGSIFSGTCLTMCVVTLDGEEWFSYNTTVTGPLNTTTLKMYGTVAGDPVAKFLYLDTNSNSTSAGQSDSRTFQAIPLYFKIKNA